MVNNSLLIVEDDYSNRETLEEIFRILGYKVFSTKSGEEALDILKKKVINIMFFDIQLPGINGIELCKRVRETNRIAVIYAMTGYSSLFQLDECREIGFDDYFLKPFTMKDITKAAQDALEKIERWTNRIVSS
jgi:CheY-like chemotaxis protein